MYRDVPLKHAFTSEKSWSSAETCHNYTQVCSTTKLLNMNQQHLHVLLVFWGLSDYRLKPDAKNDKKKTFRLWIWSGFIVNTFNSFQFISEAMRVVFSPNTLMCVYTHDSETHLICDECSTCNNTHFNQKHNKGMFSTHTHMHVSVCRTFRHLQVKQRFVIYLCI